MLIIIIIIIIIITTYSMAQQPPKSFDCPLMRVSLYNSILVSTTGRVIGDKSIVS